jgi:ABC-type uncharacterized transport system ATPase subunit
MPKYQVSVEKRLYCTGTIEVSAKDPQAAIKAVREKINKGTLQTTQVEWSDPEYEDDSLKCYGEVI